MRTSDISNRITVTLHGLGKRKAKGKCKLLGLAVKENKVPSIDRALFSDDSPVTCTITHSGSQPGV